MRKGSPERRAFFYAVSSIILENQGQKYKTRSKNTLQMGVFSPFLSIFEEKLCKYSKKNRTFLHIYAKKCGFGGPKQYVSEPTDEESHSARGTVFVPSL